MTQLPANNRIEMAARRRRELIDVGVCTRRLLHLTLLTVLLEAVQVLAFFKIILGCKS